MTLTHNHYYEKIGNKVTDITDEIPFEIPSSWQWVHLNNVVHFTIGATPERANKKFWNRGTIPWVSISDMTESGLIDCTKENITDNAITAKFRNKICEPGTLLMSFKLSIGKTAITNIKCVHNEAIISIYPYCDIDNTIRNYLFVLLGELVKFVKTTDAIKGNTLNSKKINDMWIPLPPFFEQQRIVDKLEKLEPYAKQYESLVNENEKLDKEFPDKLKQSILQYAMQGKLVEQDPNDEPASVLLDRIKQEKEKLIKEGKIKRDKNESTIYQGDDKNYYEKIGNKVTDITDEVPFEIPNSWRFCRIQSVCSTYTGNSINADEKKKRYSNRSDGYNYIGTKDVGFDNSVCYDNGVKIPYDTDFRIAHKGSTLLCVEGGSAGRKIAILEQDVCFGNKLCAFESYGINKKFLYYYLQSSVFSTLFHNKISGIIGGVSSDKLKQIIFIVPPLLDQEKISLKLDYIFSRLNK